MRKRVFATLTALALALTALAGCKAEPSDPNAPKPGQLVYAAEFTEFPGETSYEISNQLLFIGGELYFASYEERQGTALVQNRPDIDIMPRAEYGGNDLTLDAEVVPAVAVPAPEVTAAPMPLLPVPGDEAQTQTITVRVPCVYKYKPGGEVTKLFTLDPPDYMMAGRGSVYSTAFADDGENIILVVRGNEETFDDNGNYVYNPGKTELYTLSRDGNLISKIEIVSENPETELYLNAFAADKEHLYYTAENNLYVADKNGKTEFKLQPPNGDWLDRILKLPDGRVAGTGYASSADTYVARPVDTQTKAWGTEIKLGPQVYNTYPGAGDYIVYYSDELRLTGVKQTGESETLLNWLDLDLDSNQMSGMVVLPDGKIAAVFREVRNDTFKYDFVSLTKKPYEATQKKTLNVATVRLDWSVRSAILDFNRKNENYRLHVEDYYQQDAATWDAGVQQGLLRLNTEISAGHVPDIFLLDNIPAGRYAAKGLFEDLYPFIEKEPGGRSALVEPLFKAMENDGKLYSAASSFNVTLLMGDPRLVGEELSWSIDDLTKILAEHPGTTAFANLWRDDLLYSYIPLEMNAYIDWEKSKCSFDSPEFVSFLEFAKTFPVMPEKVDWSERPDESTMLKEGKALLASLYLYDFRSDQYLQVNFNGNGVFKGFPTSNGNGVVFRPNTRAAISSKSANKDGAWEFVSIILSEKWQTDGGLWSFPSNRAAYDAMAKKAMEPQYYIDENGNKVEIEDGGGGMSVSDANGSVTRYEYHRPTQADVDRITALINQGGILLDDNTEVRNIIMEEIKPFMEGQKTASAVAQIIQSKLNLYVNEQK